MKRVVLWLYSAGILVLFLAMWQEFSRGAHPLLSPFFFSRPSLIAQDLVNYAASGLLVKDLVSTLSGALAGLGLGLITGVVVGLLLGHFASLREVTMPYMIAFNSLPRPALAPLLILWFGLGLKSKIFLAWSLVFFVVMFNTLYGVTSIDKDLLRAIKVMGATRSQSTRIVTIPSVLTWIFAAFRTSVSLALIGAVVGEFVGASSGLGYRAVIAAGLFQTARVFSILLILMAVGVLMVSVASRVESIVLRWRPPSVGQ